MEDYVEKNIKLAIRLWGVYGFWKLKRALKFYWKIDIDKECLLKRLRKYEKKS